MSGFTHLHVHSHYSLLDGLPKIGQLVDRAKELGMDSIALTDHGNLYGAVEFLKDAKEKGVKPILGAEIYLAFEGMEQKRPKIDDTIYHLVVLVKNQKGYENLVNILTQGHLRGFYYKPRVDEDFLKKHAEGLIALSGCLNGKIPRLLQSKKKKEAETTALFYQEIFGKDNFYFELQRHPNIPAQKTTNQGLLELSEKLKIPVVATADSHYLSPEDSEAQDILMLINTGARPDDPDRLTLSQDDFSLKSAEDMEKLFSDIPEAIANTERIAKLCNFELELGVVKLPIFPLPAGKSADDYLQELCEKGLKERQNIQDNQETKSRLEFELSVIRQTGFASYFLIVQDFVNWAKSKRIVVGPGRGSVGGSLVAYLLKITNINPLQYNLIFERFLNPGRMDLPDIDLDFADYRRDEVIAYVADKYGRDRVAQIITFGTMAARAVVRDVGRALGYEYGYCDKMAKMIPFSFNLQQTLEEVEEFKELYDSEEKAKRLIDLAKKLEGVARHASTHACGVVIAAQPLNSLVPLQHPTQNDQNIVTQYGMHSIEDLGLLKMDFLGLKNLSVIEDTLKRIYVIHHKSIDIEAIPQDDPKAYKLFQDGNTVGLFQVESAGMQRYLRELKPTEFEDIIAMIALYRPGPMELIPDYIARKHGRKKITYIHEKLKPILETTQGICIYQEQLMRIAQDLAGFTLAEADVLRKAVGKKIKSLLEEQKEKFISGMIKNNIERKIANQLWEWVLPFARYGFNKSHSAAYATIAYQTAWLKTHYPVEFMAALLTAERNDIERIAFLIDETKKMKIEVLPPDINESFSNFSVVPDKNQIRFGLRAIKNVGEGIVEAIIEERKKSGVYKSMQDFISRISSSNLNKKSLESLIKSGAFDAFADRNKLLFNLERLLQTARESFKMKNGAQQSLFSSTPQTSIELPLEDTQVVTENLKLQWEKELLGLYVSSHPLAAVKNLLEKKAFSIAKIAQQDFKSGASTPQIRIGGIISSIKRIITKAGKPMLFLGLEDLTDKIEVVVFPSLIDKYPDIVQENKIVLIGGRLNTYHGVQKFIAEEIEELTAV
ncbi:DNA polymerase III subunit alpha [Patescibacteria group bacterium]|nr:DNA polymerase III subunit alpha [Patescibacteria group bacterium]